MASDLYPRCTRNKDRLVLDIIPYSVLFMKNSFPVCIKIFNATPDKFKPLPFKLFKRELCQWLKVQMFYACFMFCVFNVFQCPV